MDDGFVDIHCHILPGLDDGPPSWEDSLRMAELAVRQGVCVLVATPHQLGAYYHISAEAIREKWAVLRRKIEEAGLPLRLECGADIHIEPELPAKLLRGEVLPLSPAGKYVLVEPPWDVLIPIGGVLRTLRNHGFEPILTHPERIPVLSRQIELLRNWVAEGGLIQLTGGSLIGAFGLEVQARAERLLREGLVHVVASDAHGPLRRRPLWLRVYERLEELVGEDVAELLCRENPHRILSGQEVVTPQVPSGCLPRILRWMYRKAS